MKYTQKPVSIFPNNVLLQSHEIFHFVAISHEYQIFKCVSNAAILFLLFYWHRHVVRAYQRRGIHLVITSWHIFPVHPFTLAPFFAFRLICLSYINKSFVMKMSYLLHRAKLLRVTSSSTWRGVTSLPVKTLNCHISRTRHTSIPVFVLNCDQVTSILYTKNRAISPTGYLTLICAVWSSRGRSYLLPLSHRADVECLRHLLISVKLVTNINSTTVMWHTFHYRDLT